MGGWSRDLGILTADQVVETLRERTADLRGQWAKDEAPPIHASTVAMIAKAAEGAIAAMGGKAHLHVGASFQCDSEGKWTQNSISVTATVTTRGSEPPTPPPGPEPKRRAVGEEWEP
jgi:hypothetical protein